MLVQCRDLHGHLCVIQVSTIDDEWPHLVLVLVLVLVLSGEERTASPM